MGITLLWAVLAHGRAIVAVGGICYTGDGVLFGGSASP